MDADKRLTILQSKFAAYLSWSQPFIHHLIRGLDPFVNNVIACNRVENLERFPIGDHIRFPNRYLVEPRLAVLAAQHVKRIFEPDLIHAHFGWSGLRMLLQKQFLRIPMVVTFGGRDVGVQMRLEYFDRLYEVLLEATDEMICVSKDLRGKLIAAGGDRDRIRVIYRGCDVDSFHFVDRSDRPADAPAQALMVGRLVEKKGHRFALEAIAELVRRGTDLRVVVVGEGEDYGRIRRMARRLGLRRHVDFVGSTDHVGVRRHMAESDFLIHPSVTPPDGDTEGIPNAVVEGQAMGLPVVATQHGGIVEAVLEGETGLLVPEGDVEGLANAVSALASDRARRLDMGRAARRFIERDFNLKAQVALHVDIYRKLVAEYAADPRRSERVWIPEDYAELVRLTIRNHEEFSVAELLERLIWVRRMETSFAEPVPRPSKLERLYDLKRYVPQMIKYPVKVAAGRTISQAIEVRYRSQGSSNYETLEGMDRRVLDYFREGGEMGVENDEWQELERMLKLHPRVDDVQTRRGRRRARPRG